MDSQRSIKRRANIGCEMLDEGYVDDFAKFSTIKVINFSMLRTQADRYVLGVRLLCDPESGQYKNSK